MDFDKSLLYHFVRDSLRSYSEDFQIADRNNPTIFKLNNQRYSIHVSYIHDSGNKRVNNNEVRIQIGRALIECQRTRNTEGVHVAFLGFFEGGKSFVAWDPRHIFSLQTQTGVSVYARQTQQVIVESNQTAAVYTFKAVRLQEKSIAIALPANVLGFYCENIKSFHKLPTENDVSKLIKDHLETFADGGLGTDGELYHEAGGQRERFTYKRKAFPRDPRFTKLVLDAYQHTCCVCNRQLGIIQAAHIIPHSEPDSPNNVQNGLAMCIEHHQLYDDALLLPGPYQVLILNENRVEYLNQTNQKKGLKDVEAFNDQKFRVPDNPKLQPCDEYLQRGLEIRFAG